MHGPQTCWSLSSVLRGHHAQVLRLPSADPPDAHAFVRTPEVRRGIGAAESAGPARNLCPYLLLTSASKAARLPPRWG